MQWFAIFWLLLRGGTKNISKNPILSMSASFDCEAAVATWNFGALALDHSIVRLKNEGSALDAVETGIRALELDTQDQYFVGVGGLPNADGVMELDAAIMDDLKRYGAVMCLQNIKNPISVARSILEKCVHNILIGDGALQWALNHGFVLEPDVLTDKSRLEWQTWKNGLLDNSDITSEHHDTVGLICIDCNGKLAVGTSTSGWKFKHPGRVGDAPLIGSGLYCDGRVGAAAATGDGEEIMRTCLSFLVVEMMRQGLSPQQACCEGIKRIHELVPSHVEGIDDNDQSMHVKLTVGVIAMDALGNIGAASTLSEGNDHRGKPYFPAVAWRRRRGSDGTWDEEIKCTLQASVDGASF